MKIREDAEPFANSDELWYCLTDGGYLKPEDYLSKEDAKKVNEAVSVVQDFLESMEEAGKIEEM